MSKEIYQITDAFSGQTYFCSSKQAVRAVISDLTALPINDPAVKEAAEGQSESFFIETHPLYGKSGV